MTRRDAYLLTWGTAYVSLGIFVYGAGGLGDWWATGAFVLVGALAIVAGLTRWAPLVPLVFAGLSVVAVLAALHYIFAFFWRGQPRSLWAAVMWLAVAIAQVIVAGWPANERVERRHRWVGRAK
jgi:hypothetical protein